MSLLPSVFVSYARTDSDSIQYAVSLLEAGGAEVFRDIDDIRFGDRWEDVITERINDCERVLVFWSKAAQQSEWVGREYQMALAVGKTLVPVLLDSTPLPADLGAFHALTLSHFTPKTSRLQRYGGWVLGGVATTALAGVLGSQLLLNSADDASFNVNGPPDLSDSLTEDTAAAGVVSTDSGASADTPSLAQSAEVLIEAQAFEQSALPPDPELSAAESNAAGVDSNTTTNTTADSAQRVDSTYEDNEVSIAAARQGTTLPPKQSSSRRDSAAVAVPEALRIPAPAVAVPKPVTDAQSSENEATAVSGSAAEGMPLAQLLPWIVGILVLLSLCWLAVRRFGKRDDPAAASERFVEMVFDKHS